MAKRSEAAFLGATRDAKGAFFHVFHTTARTQAGTMTVGPGKEAGPAEVHEDSDQVFLVLEGEAEFKVWEQGEDQPPLQRRLGPGGVVVVPAGMRHWVRSVGEGPLFFFTVYGPPAY